MSSNTETLNAIKPQGPFVLMVFEGEDILTDERGTVMINGKPKWIAVGRLYFECDLGENKAKYWTRDIQSAQVFESVDDATAMLCKQRNPHLIRVRHLSQITREVQP